LRDRPRPGRPPKMTCEREQHLHGGAACHGRGRRGNPPRLWAGQSGDAQGAWGDSRPPARGRA
jgi:hypothetical protein